MAAGDITEEVQGSFGGLDVYTGLIVMNGTTVVTITTGWRKINSVQLTWAEEPANFTTALLDATWSGGTVSCDCAAASGAIKASFMILGYRG